MTMVRRRTRVDRQEVIRSTPLFLTLTDESVNWEKLAKLIISFLSDLDCKKLGVKLGKAGVIQWSSEYARNREQESLSSNKNLLYDLLSALDKSQDLDVAVETLLSFIMATARLHTFGTHVKESNY